MLYYDLSPEVEAFSTNITDAIGFDVCVPSLQAHSTKVAIVDDDNVNTHGIDAVITSIRGKRIGVRTADCVPILAYDTKLKVAAAIHSGWKGTLGNIINSTLKEMHTNFGCEPTNIRAVIGPCIHQEAFEVGDELYDQFKEKGYEDYCNLMPRYGEEDNIKWHINLPGICHKQLMDCGVSSIEVRKECTYTLYHKFYSARREKENLSDHRIYNCIKIL